MRVREVMKTQIVSVLPDVTYEEAARLMHQHGFSGLPDIDKKGKLIGLISEKDLFKAMYPDYAEFVQDSDSSIDQEQQEMAIEGVRNQPVSAYMTRSVLTIEPDAPVMKAGGLMLARGVHRLPVVEKGNLVGIVTRREIYGTILQRRLGFDRNVRLLATDPPRRVGNI